YQVSFMKNLFRNSGWFFVGAACVGLSVPAFADDLYDNLSNPFSTYYPMVTGTQAGNQIDLSGGNGGTLNSFTFNYYGTATGANWAGAVQFAAALYQNDGALLHPGDSHSAQPGTVLGQ